VKRMLIGKDMNEVSSKTRILIVEDNTFGRSVMQMMLNEMGIFFIGLAGNGIEAVNEYKFAVENNQQYEIVLMDLILPELDGY